MKTIAYPVVDVKRQKKQRGTDEIPYYNEALDADLNDKNEAYGRLSKLTPKKGLYDQFFGYLRIVGSKESMTYCLIVDRLMNDGSDLRDALETAFHAVMQGSRMKSSWTSSPTP